MFRLYQVVFHTRCKEKKYISTPGVECFICECVYAHIYIWGGGHCLLYSLKTGTLPEPGAGLAATNTTVLLSHLPLCCGYRSLWPQQAFKWIWGFELWPLHWHRGTPTPWAFSPVPLVYLFSRLDAFLKWFRNRQMRNNFFLLGFKRKFLFNYVYNCVGPFMWVQVLLEARGVRFPAAAVTGCELCQVSAGNWTLSFCRNTASS